MQLSGAAVDGVKVLCAELAMTPNIALLTIFSVLLSMSGVGQDMVVGVPADMRERDGRDAVGYHVNLIAIRVQMLPDSSLRAVAHAVREAYLGGLMHARCRSTNCSLAHTRRRERIAIRCSGTCSTTGPYAA